MGYSTRNILFILLLLGNPVLAQNRQYYKGEKINQLDSLQRKTGKWIEFFNECDSASGIKSSGYYNKNRKIGKWTYYEWDFDYTTHQEYFYYENGIKNITGGEIYDFNTDSTIIRVYQTGYSRKDIGKKNPRRALHMIMKCTKDNNAGCYQCKINTLRLQANRTICDLKKIYTGWF